MMLILSTKTLHDDCQLLQNNSHLRQMQCDVSNIQKYIIENQENKNLTLLQNMYICSMQVFFCLSNSIHKCYHRVQIQLKLNDRHLVRSTRKRKQSSMNTIS